MSTAMFKKSSELLHDDVDWESIQICVCCDWWWGSDPPFHFRPQNQTLMYHGTSKDYETPQ